jgi:acid phosphatase
VRQDSRRTLQGRWRTAAIAALAIVLAWLAWRSAAYPAAPLPSAVALPGPGRLALPGEITSLKLAVMGDVGHGNALQYDTAAELARWHDRFRFDLVLLTGDNIYGVGTRDDYRTKFEIPYEPLIRRGVAFQAVRGNHDPDNITSFVPFGMNGRRYYSFTREFGPRWDRRSALFLAVDTIDMDRAQLDWIEQELDRDADWKIAFQHYPLYSSGRYWFRARRTRGTLEPLFLRGGIQVAFSGHEHVYERVHPQRGIQYFTSGGGGDFRAGDLDAGAMTARGFDGDTHFMLVEITKDAMHFQVISRTGETVDLGVVARTPAARLSPASRP